MGTEAQGHCFHSTVNAASLSLMIIIQEGGFGCGLPGVKGLRQAHLVQPTQVCTHCPFHLCLQL